MTRCDGSELLLNHELIETIEEAPYTIVFLTSGRNYLVKETAETVVDRIVAFKVRLARRIALDVPE